jgi:hypothetical protein
MTKAMQVTVHLEFPLWVIMPPSIKINDIAHAKIRSGTKGILLFTDQVGAQEFLDANSNFPGNSIRPIIDGWHLFGLLCLAEKVGFTNVIIDPTPAPGSVPTSASHGIPIVDLRSGFEQMAL